MHNKCQCELAGYCERHKMNKTQSMVDSCKRNIDMFLHHERIAGNIQEPSITQKAINYASAEIKHTYNGRGEVSPEVYDYRMNICKSCPLFVESNKTCLKCGCYLETKCKWIEQECPEGKWKSELGDTSGKCGSCS